MKILLKIILSIALFLGSISFCFMLGATIGSYNTSFCLPNGCGYEAMGVTGIFVGLILGSFLVLLVNKFDLFD